MIGRHTFNQGETTVFMKLPNNNEKVFLGDKKVISSNKKTEEMIKEYKEKNKVRRHFTQKKPLNK